MIIWRRPPTPRGEVLDPPPDELDRRKLHRPTLYSAGGALPEVWMSSGISLAMRLRTAGSSITMTASSNSDGALSSFTGPKRASSCVSFTQPRRSPCPSGSGASSQSCSPGW